MRDATAQMESRVPHHIPGMSSSIISQPLLDSRVPYGRLQHPLTIFPIDQIKSSHVENDYIDSPTVVSQQPTSQKAANRGSNEALLEAPHHPSLARGDPHDTTTHPWISFSGRPSSISSSSSTSSDQRLLDHAAPTPVLDQAAPTPALDHGSTVAPRAQCCGPKVVTSTPLDPKAAARGATVATDKKHSLPCETCGKCRCTECTLPRTLPSCWVCNQECLCSVQSLVDSATCMCLVKAIFYHCTEDEDDEGSCADRPCSCRQSHCCARWSFMAAASLLLPCLVCYLPATGCVKLSQKCYDRTSRPGCRCKNSQSACQGSQVKAGVQEKQGS